MATEIRVPTLGESVSEATVGTWFKKVGDFVKADEPLVELETDKVTVEVPSPTSGVLTEIVAQNGETVGLDALLGQIAEGAAGAATTAPAAAASAPAAAVSAPAPAAAAAPATGSMPAAPAAAKVAADNNISTADIDGSGKRGQVLKGDVLAAVAKGASAPVAAAPVSAPRPVSSAEDGVREERVKMTRLRQTIAKRLKDAQNTAAMLTTYNEVDMSAVMDLRNRYKDVFEKKHGVKLGFMGFFTKAVTHALKELPAVNAEIDGTDIIYKNYCHVGMAVGTDKGLVVPVIRDADQRSIAGVEKELGRLAKAARDGSLSMADMQGGTFTITNGGVYGSLMSSPILNAPQSGILGMHKIQERPVAIGGQVVIRPMMYLALSYDHRIVDGKEAVTFLVRVKESLEDPERLVLDL
ncbi:MULTISPECIES: 2-oxoglutarate dehydrogenase complex dihydrolipoyllysine-residue succinyltransferase [unclassified Agrobacterium]|jgi:2-oxoglutarate dehydrogenase E2 component (dihydrolipoamide succinyltransferase)|uniref:2-oxoglutarate dehydrogenase complex dihydrolipoyllysine-residue succinyltransferase n=1 Tax=unclassified Agrobacterium TaxID=2632611 RepID=UPI00177C0351|nr:2-oxoglutarate dehydrogenase complex dihydrolipoyllysine-residue succinyltransferase [Agrobacterium sp. AGB01]MBD9389394.1 2-oxoglutarate dehydrogenase complex dihydrolipoyllysine-residue succinyltransferase [Agrobacterium sp. AGB01]